MKHEGQRSVRSREGFTLVEVLMVMIIMGIMMAISIPSFMGWRENLKYRETAREVASMLREAKSRAITNNQEQQVQFDAINQQYGLRPGNRAYSTNWSDYVTTPLASNWMVLDSQVKIVFAIQPPPAIAPPATDPPGSIQYTPNGAASAWGVIKIQDHDLVTKFCVMVIPIGRISVITPASDPVNCT
jgi:type II secretion system protein H